MQFEKQHENFNKYNIIKNDVDKKDDVNKLLNNEVFDYSSNLSFYEQWKMRNKI